MTYQKLTYSGTECKNYLYFSFDAEFFDTAILTNELKLEPTSVMIKKDPVPKSTAWMYRIDAGSDIDLEIHLEKLIDTFENKVDAIILLKEKLKLETRLQFVIHVDINPESSTPYFGLNKRTIYFLEKTGTEVDFDLYKADTIGLLNKLTE